MKTPIKRFLAFKLNHFAVLLPVFALLISSCSGPTSPERPIDPWVYRSVLDERPRMITIALHDDLWSAYDVRRCGLYKAWKGGVIFDGAVYTTKHGPQPNSYGAAYITDLLEQPIWWLRDQDQQISVIPQYKGHLFQNNQVSLNYLIAHGDQQILIKETPEYIQSNQAPGLVRTFEVEGLQEGQSINLQVVLSSLPNEFAYSASSDFQVKNKESKTYGGQKTLSVTGVLSLQNGSNRLEAYFDGTNNGKGILPVHKSR